MDQNEVSYKVGPFQLIKEKKNQKERPVTNAILQIKTFLKINPGWTMCEEIYDFTHFSVVCKQNCCSKVKRGGRTCPRPVSLTAKLLSTHMQEGF